MSLFSEIILDQNLFAKEKGMVFKVRKAKNEEIKWL